MGVFANSMLKNLNFVIFNLVTHLGTKFIFYLKVLC